MRRGWDFVALRAPTSLTGEVLHNQTSWPQLASLVCGFFVAPHSNKFDSAPQKSPTYFRRRGHLLLCGGGGIRTHDTDEGMPVFKTGAFSQALPPLLA